MGAEKQTSEDFYDRINLIVIHPAPYIRAGSSFFQSLFDGHPEVLTLPYLKSIHTQIPESIENIDIILNDFIKNNGSLFDIEKGYYGPNPLTAVKGFGKDFNEHIRTRKTDFSDRFKALLQNYPIAGNTLTRKQFFILIHLAYHNVRNIEKIREVKYLLYNPHDKISWEDLSADFPRLKYIAMMRDPWANWISHRQLIKNRTGLEAQSLSIIWLIHCTRIYAPSIVKLSDIYSRIDSRRFRILDLDRFHQLNRTALDSLCSWLEIGFNECLLVSSFMGKSWGGNAGNGITTTGFKPHTQPYAWRTILTSTEQRFISNYLSNSIRFLRYTDALTADGDQPALDDFEKTVNQNLSSGQYWLYFIQRAKEILHAAQLLNENNNIFIRFLKYTKRIIDSIPYFAFFAVNCLTRNRDKLGLGSNPDLHLKDSHAPDKECFV
jgi:hypothetical protein